MATQLLSIKVKPNARTAELAQCDDGTWHANLRTPPVDGKANAELIALVAQYFGCVKSSVAIVAGAGSRSKRVRVEA